MEKINLLNEEQLNVFLSKEIKKILFIGGVDTGKTTLLKYISNFLFKKGENVFILDCDVGQSHIGPPTTVGYAKLKEKIEDFNLDADRFYFVGSVTPSNSIIEFIAGISIMNQFISKEKGKILIDTTGYVKNRLAISLKIHKIEILTPDFVFLLEKEKELEEIERFLKFSGIKFTKIKVENIPVKSMEERNIFRKNRFLQYFGNLKKINLNMDKVSIKITNLGGVYNVFEIKNLNLRGNLCGLKRSNLDYFCLGVIANMKNEWAEIFIPEKVNINNTDIKSISISNYSILEIVSVE